MLADGTVWIEIEMLTEWVFDVANDSDDRNLYHPIPVWPAMRILLRTRSCFFALMEL